MDAAFRYGGALALLVLFWITFAITGNSTLGLYVGAAAALVWLAFGLLVRPKELRKARAIREQKED